MDTGLLILHPLPPNSVGPANPICCIMEAQKIRATTDSNQIKNRSRKHVKIALIEVSQRSIYYFSYSIIGFLKIAMFSLYCRQFLENLLFFKVFRIDIRWNYL